MQALVLACPLLSSLIISGFCLPEALLRTLGDACPLLTGLTITGAGLSHLPYLQHTLLLLQPTLLPQIDTLDFCTCEPDFQIPDMSHNDSILHLRLDSFIFQDIRQWLCLPRGLQHLASGPFLVGPPDLDNGGPCLGSLKSMHAELDLDWIDTPFSLHALAQFFRATAALTEFALDIWEERAAIAVDLTGPAAAANAADLLLLCESAEVHGAIKDALFAINCGEPGHGDIPFQHLIPALPRMTGFTQCRFENVLAGHLASLLGVFPDVEDVRLVSLGDLDDVELQDVAKCTKLTKLHLSACNRVSSMGLLSLCHSSPMLRYISLRLCDGLKNPAVEGCKSLLLKHGLQVEIKDVSGGE